MKYPLKKLYVYLTLVKLKKNKHSHLILLSCIWHSLRVF